MTDDADNREVEEFSDINHDQTYDSENIIYDSSDFIIPIISTIFSIAFLLFEIVITSKGFSPIEKLFNDCTGVKLNIVEKSFQIIDKKCIYAFWGFHCASLLVLPILFVFTFKWEHKHIYSIAPPFMMLFNAIGCLLPMKYSSIPIFFELIIASILLYKLPFKSVYVLSCGRIKSFLLGEITLMLLSFTYISIALSISPLPYILFGKLKNPYYAIEMSFLCRQYLSIYSLFTFLIVGLGLCMTFRNSILMTIPYAILTIFTLVKTRKIGYLFLGLTVLHIIYILLLQFRPTRNLLGGCCKFCSKSFIETTKVITISDFIIFFFLALPSLLFIIAYDPKPKKNSNVNQQTENFSAIVLIVSIGLTITIIFHTLFLTFQFFSLLIVSSLTIIGVSVLILIFGHQSEKSIKLFTYDITYLTWNFMLNVWASSNGFSPILYRFYAALVPFAAYLITCFFEPGDNFKNSIFELVCACFQFIVDIVYFQIATTLNSKYVSCIFTAFAGLSVFGALILGFFYLMAVIINFICSFICSFICDHICCCEGLTTKDLHDIFDGTLTDFAAPFYAHITGKKAGDDFYFGGRKYHCSKDDD